MQKRYVLIIENLIEPLSIGAKRLTILLVDTEQVHPIIDGTIAREHREDIEKMVMAMYGDDLRIVSRH